MTSELPDETSEHAGADVPSDAPRTSDELPATTDDELAAELRRLFEDDRLSLVVRGDAADTVVAAAGRRRRRQVVLASAAAVLAVLAMVSAGVATLAMTRSHGLQTALSGLSTRPDTDTTPATSDTTGAPSPAPPADGPTGRPSVSQSRHVSTPPLPPVQPVGVLLTADGYGLLRLGMSEQDAVAAGLIDDPATTPPPTSARAGATSTTAAPPVPATCDVRRSTRYPWITAAFDPDSGLDQITAAEAHTPQGVGTGSTTDQILAAYPTADAGATSIRVVGAASEYVFELRDGVVGSVTVQTGNTVNCTTS